MENALATKEILKKLIQPTDEKTTDAEVNILRNKIKELEKEIEKEGVDFNRKIDAKRFDINHIEKEISELENSGNSIDFKVINPSDSSHAEKSKNTNSQSRKIR